MKKFLVKTAIFFICIIIATISTSAFAADIISPREKLDSAITDYNNDVINTLKENGLYESTIDCYVFLQLKNITISKTVKHQLPLKILAYYIEIGRETAKENGVWKMYFFKMMAEFDNYGLQAQQLVAKGKEHYEQNMELKMRITAAIYHELNDKNKDLFSKGTLTIKTMIENQPEILMHINFEY